MNQAFGRVVASVMRRALSAATRGASYSLEQGLLHPRMSQDRLLRSLLAAHEATEYGREHQLHRGLSREEFRRRLPVVSYHEGALTGWIQRQQQAPQRSIISPGGVRTFQKTSGSAAASKLIPYNQALLRSFERYFCAWLHDLLRSGPALTTLHTFVSLSPAVQSADDQGSTQGLQDDAEYLSPWFRRLIKPFLSVPLALKTVEDGGLFKDLACAYLVKDVDLEVISVWHPSFFTILWQHLVVHRERIAQLLTDGTVVPAAPEAAARLLAAGPELQPADLWPRLKLISAWSAAQSAGPARTLQQLCPEVFFQGKGLLATEAPMTVPLIGRGTVPFVTEVLFELVDQQGRYWWLDEVDVGVVYTLVISQRGGLLRYATGDQVQVTAKLGGGAPVLDFVGREGEATDLVGEKLTAAYLVARQDAFFERFKAKSYCFLPRLSGPRGRPCYVLLIDGGEDASDQNDTMQQAAAWWEEQLQQSYHYQYARSLDQLGPVAARSVNDLDETLQGYFQRKRQMKAGDVKPRILVNDCNDADTIWELL